jgi:hypothetical protein
MRLEEGGATLCWLVHPGLVEGNALFFDISNDGVDFFNSTINVPVNENTAIHVPPEYFTGVEFLRVRTEVNQSAARTIHFTAVP